MYNPISKKRFYWLFCLLLVSSQATLAQSTLSVMTYNIHHANPPSRPDYIDIEAIARVINDSGVDVVALQEVDVNNQRSGETLDQAREIAERTGMQHFFAKGIDLLGGEYGVAILSKYPIVQTKRYALPMIKGTKGEPRALAVATLLVDGKKVIIANTHLDLTEENRLRQAEFIVRKLKKKRHPVILCGDLNAAPDSRVMEIFLAHFSHSVPAGPTFPQDQPRRQIDYILHRPEQGLSVADGGIIQEPYASDHLPVYVGFTF